ncbi:MAG: glycosyltransferase family 2 protein [Rhizobiaceae bacterium]
MIPSPAHGSVSVLARSPGLDASGVEVVVTLPTFRRPQQVLDTLASLKAQRTSRHFAVITMENDAAKAEGAAAAAPLFEAGDIEGMLIIAHERGNCSAYNAGWQTALLQFPNFRYLLVIDDDETADPDWLENMCACAERFGADMVGGPQVPTFEDPANAHWAKHPVFAPPYSRSGPVKALYSSGNLLLTRDQLARMGPPFLDLRFNFLGGGDSDFLSRSARAGFKPAWCADGILREIVPPRRLERDWVRARSIRNGVISTLIELKQRRGQPLGALKTFAKSVALLGVSPWRGLKLTLATGSLAAGIHPFNVGLGRVLAHFGYAREQYREPEKN